MDAAAGNRILLIAGILLAPLLTGCDGSPPPEQVAEEPATRGLRAEACSEIEVTDGVAESEWVLESTRDQVSPGRSISTTDVALSPDGSLYVVDAREARVTHLAPDGAVLEEWGR